MYVECVEMAKFSDFPHVGHGFRRNFSIYILLFNFAMKGLIINWLKWHEPQKKSPRRPINGKTPKAFIERYRKIRRKF
jgi:hypothetical protein